MKFAVDFGKILTHASSVSQKEQNERRIDAMESSEILEIFDRSVAYAAVQMKSKTWRGAKTGVPPLAQSSKDLAQLAFEKILDGAKWDEGKPLWLVIRGLIRGWVSNFAKLLENQANLNGEDHSSEEGGWSNWLDQIQADTVTPVSIIEREADDDVILEILESYPDGSDERKVVESIISGAYRRAEILKDTGLSAAKYEATKKRLQRSLEKYRQILTAAHH